MKSRYIVSHYIFAEHSSFEEAEAERIRLSEKFAKKAFKVYCISDDFENPDLSDPKRRPKTRHWQRMFWPENKTAQPGKRKITLANFKPKPETSVV